MEERRRTCVVKCTRAGLGVNVVCDPAVCGIHGGEACADFVADMLWYSFSSMSVGMEQHMHLFTIVVAARQRLYGFINNDAESSSLVLTRYSSRLWAEQSRP